MDIDCYDLKGCPGECPAAGWDGCIANPRVRRELDLVAQDPEVKDPTICDWTACPHFDGPCCDPSCPGWEMKEAREARRRAVAGMAFICFALCGVLLWVAAHFGGGR